MQNRNYFAQEKEARNVQPGAITPCVRHHDMIYKYTLNNGTTFYPLVILNGISDDGKLSGIHCNSNDVCDWMQQFDGWEQIQRFLAINVDNGGIVFAYKWGAEGWYSSDCLTDCNDFEQRAFREMMAEVGIDAQFLNNPNWIRYELVGDSVANIRKFMKF